MLLLFSITIDLKAEEEKQLPVGNIDPQFTRLFLTSGPKSAELYSLKDNAVKPLPISTSSTITCSVFSPNGKLIAIGEKDGTVRIWNAATAAQLVDLGRHPYTIFDLEFSPDSSKLLVVSLNSYATSWVIPPGTTQEELKKLQAAPSREDSAWLWDVATSKQIGNYMPHRSFDGAHFSPDGKRIVTCSIDTVQIWDAATATQIGESIEKTGYGERACFTSDGTKLLIAGALTVQLWDIATGKPLGKPMAHERRIQHASLSPDGSKVVTASEDKTARIWDAATGAPLSEPLPHKASVSFACFTPDGTKIITATTGKFVRIWSVATGKMLSIARSDIKTGELQPRGIRFQPKSNHFMFLPVTLDNFEYWDSESGQPHGPPLKLP